MIPSFVWSVPVSLYVPALSALYTSVFHTIDSLSFALLSSVTFTSFGRASFSAGVPNFTVRSASFSTAITTLSSGCGGSTSPPFSSTVTLIVTVLKLSGSLIPSFAWSVPVSSYVPASSALYASVFHSTDSLSSVSLSNVTFTSVGRASFSTEVPNSTVRSVSSSTFVTTLSSGCGGFTSLSSTITLIVTVLNLSGILTPFFFWSSPDSVCVPIWSAL